MVLFNYALKELTAKIVYYGPGLSGKTTNLQYIYEELPIKNKGRMLTLATETDRTLYFDFLPVDAGVVRGIRTRVQLYTVPGQVFYNATRRMVLKGVDGVVFVADSQRGVVEANLESFNNLRENLAAHDLKIDKMPLVMQYNKRDLDAAMSVDEMSEKVNLLNAPFYEAIAKDGVGVEDTLRAISSLVLKSVIEKYGGDRSMSPLGSVGSAESGAGGIDLVGSTIPPAAPSPTVDEPLVALGVEVTNVTPKDNVASTWPNPPEDTAVADKQDKPVETFENLNLEGILDEALKMHEPEGGSAGAQPAPAGLAASSQGLDDSADAFSGLLEEALGEESNESLANSLESLSESNEVSTAPGSPNPAAEEEGIAAFELDIDEPKPERIKATNAQARLHDLAQTRLSGSADVKFANVKVNPRRASQPKRVEIPLTINIDPDADEIDIQLILNLRLKREK